MVGCNDILAQRRRPISFDFPGSSDTEEILGQEYVKSYLELFDTRQIRKYVVTIEISGKMPKLAVFQPHLKSIFMVTSHS